jgi:hypothetical protein
LHLENPSDAIGLLTGYAPAPIQIRCEKEDPISRPATPHTGFSAITMLQSATVGVY